MSCLCDICRGKLESDTTESLKEKHPDWYINDKVIDNRIIMICPDCIIIMKIIGRDLLKGELK